MLFEPLFNPLDAACKSELDRLCACAAQCFPVPPRFLFSLPRDIAALSDLLTSARPLRRDGYLGSPQNIAAYCRYFLPWNVFRLCKLFSSSTLRETIISAFSAENAVLSDVGAGPFTMPLALWIAFPELRDKNIAVYATDHNKLVLKSGKKLFYAFAGEKTAWKLVTRHGRLETGSDAPGAAFLTAVYVLNEVFGRLPQADSAALKQSAEKIAAGFARRAQKNGTILVVEPGVPRSAQYLAFLKTAFEKFGFFAHYPCPSDTKCPASGGKRGSKWCHFVFDTDEAPSALQKISAEAGLAKNRATVSFLLLKQGIPSKNEGCTVRVISEMFPLAGGKSGRYGCSSEGLLLLRGAPETQALLAPGTMLNVKDQRPGEKDPKTHAPIVDLKGAARQFTL